MTRDEALNALAQDYWRGDLTMYLGAGVSMGTDLPSWDKLLLSMYYDALESSHSVHPKRTLPNYLYAIAEWHLKALPPEPEITARKVRQQFKNSNDFLGALKRSLWGPFLNPSTSSIKTPDQELVRRGNPTLDAVARLCRSGPQSGSVKAVVTYNFDSLLEMALTRDKCEALWKSGMAAPPGRLPIYHVHGFVPIRSGGSTPDELVFTEEQFHAAALDPLSWLNLVQIQALTGSTCLMVGLSLNDRNLRRLLESLRKLPVRRQHFALLERKCPPQLGQKEIEGIHAKAMEYRERFERSGAKPATRRVEEINDIVKDVHRHDQNERTRMFRELGIEPIWYDRHTEVPTFLDELASRSSAMVGS